METATADTSQLMTHSVNYSSGAKKNVKFPSNKAHSKPASKPHQYSQYQSQNRTNAVRCYSCGDPNHVRPNCKFRNYNCSICKKRGHLPKVCRIKQVNNIDSPTSSFDIYDNNDFGLNTLFCLESDIKLVDPVFLKLRVNGVPITFQVDTGSAISAMKLETAQKLLKVNPDNLQPSSLKFRVYTNETINPLGTFKVKVNHSITSDLYIFQDDKAGPAIVGRDWLVQLGILQCDSPGTKISNINFVNVDDFYK